MNNAITNLEQANGFFSKAAVENGKYAAEEKAAWIEAQIRETLAAIPEGTRDQYSDDDTVAAAQYYTVYQQALATMQGGTAGGMIPGASAPATPATAGAKATAGKVTAFVAPALPSAAAEAINDILQNEREEKQRRGQSARIEKLTLQQPGMASLLKELGTLTAVPDVTPEKMKEYKEKLFDNAATQKEDGFNSKENFAKLEAALGKKPVDIHTTQPRSVKGALVSWEETKEGKAERITQQFSIEGLKGFLNTKVRTKIGTNPENGLGVEVSSIQTRLITADGTQTLGAGKKKEHIVRLRWDTGKKDVLDNQENNANINYVNAPQREGGKLVTSKEARTVRLALPFKIKTVDSSNSIKNEKITTVRPTGKVLLPVFARASEEMASVFGPDRNQPINANMGLKAQAEADEIQRQFLAAAAAGEMGPTALYGQELQNIVSTLRKAESSAVAPAAMFS